MNPKGKPSLDPQVFLAKVNGAGRAISDYRKDQIVFRQGDPSERQVLTLASVFRSARCGSLGSARSQTQ